MTTHDLVENLHVDLFEMTTWAIEKPCPNSGFGRDELFSTAIADGNDA